MREKILALSFAKRSDAEKCSRIMRDAVVLLVENGVTFDCMLYPYADSLLIQRDGSFGTHSLFYRVDAQLLDRCIARVLEQHNEKKLRYTISEIECLTAEISKFLSGSPAKKKRGTVCFGGLAQSLGGVVYPWSVRECSKLLCAFSEQAASGKGVKLIGYTGEGPQFVCSGKEVPRLAQLYERKTGAAARVSVKII